MVPGHMRTLPSLAIAIAIAIAIAVQLVAARAARADEAQLPKTAETEPAPPVSPPDAPPPVAEPVVVPPVAEPVSPPPPHDVPAIEARYQRGLTFSTADRAFELRVSFRNQIRFDSHRTTDGDDQFASRFSVPRSRLQIDGNFLGETNRYKLEFSMGDLGSFSFVRDIFVEKRISNTPVWIRAGQWKRPFNRQELVSDFYSEFNERANVAAFVGGGRDIGVAIHNDYEKSPEGLEWVFGVFNGFSGGSDRPVIASTCPQTTMPGSVLCTTPAPTTVPSDFGPALVARVGWNVGKIKGYSEGDLEGGGPRLAVGLSYKIDLANLASTDALSHGLEIDAMFKRDGLGVLVGGYAMKLKTADVQYGALVQPGYFVIPKHGQVAARFAYAPVGSQKQIEGRAAFNWYWEGHSWKWATDVGVVKLTEGSSTMTSPADMQLRTMLQAML